MNSPTTITTTMTTAIIASTRNVMPAEQEESPDLLLADSAELPSLRRPRDRLTTPMNPNNDDDGHDHSESRRHDADAADDRDQRHDQQQRRKAELETGRASTIRADGKAIASPRRPAPAARPPARAVVQSRQPRPRRASNPWRPSGSPPRSADKSAGRTQRLRSWLILLDGCDTLAILLGHAGGTADDLPEDDAA